MNKRIIVLMMLVMLVSLVGCEGNVTDKAIDQGYLELESKEYDEAMNSFKTAIDQGSEDEDISILVKFIENFNQGKKLIEEGKIEEAKEILNSIDENFISSSFKNDVDYLKNTIVEHEKKENDEFINNEIESIEQLISEYKYTDAKTKSEQLISSEKIISESQRQKIDEHTITCDKELVKIEEEKTKKKKAEEQRLQAEKVKKEKPQQEYCIGNHYVDKKDFIEGEGRCKGCSIDRTLTSSSSFVDCSNCGAIGSIMRQDGICSECNTKVIPAIVGLENDGTITYDDGTKGTQETDRFLN